MAILIPEVVQFAAGNTDFYEAAYDNYHNPSPEKETLLNKAFFAEVERKSGVSREGLTLEAWMSHPSVTWASFAIVDATINAILPSVLTPAFGVFMDMKYVGVGDIAKFKIMPNSLYTVSKGGRAERTTFRQRKHAGDILVVPQEHIITIYVNMYSVLAGKESIAEFVRLVVMAIEQDMYAEAVTALTTGLSALSTPYTYTGAFDMATLLTMAEQVQAYNQGVRPVIAGTAVALMNVIPDSASGYRGNYDANGGSINLLRGVYGFDVLKLDQAASKNGGLVLPNDQIFVVSPSQDKLVKGAISNAMTNSNQFYDNADLTEDFTYRKNYAFTYASAAKAAVYKITA